MLHAHGTALRILITTHRFPSPARPLPALFFPPLVHLENRAKPRGYAFTTEKLSKTPNDRVKVAFAWILSHRPDKECALHNHPLSEDASAHPTHRHFEEEDIAIISSLAIVGIAPREIRPFSYNNSNTLAVRVGCRWRVKCVIRLIAVVWWRIGSWAMRWETMF
jgi:hypothetical protein